MLTIAVSFSLSLSLPPLVSTLFYLFNLTSFFTSPCTCPPLPPTWYFHPFLCLLLPPLRPPPLPPLLNAPSGGFGYAGMQSSSQSQFSYNLSQGSRARTESSDVNEALYNLDRVLLGKSAAHMHEGTGCVCWV